MDSLPRSELTRFTPIEPTVMVQAYLAKSRGQSLGKLKRGLKSLLDAEEIDRAVEKLTASGTVFEERNYLRITKESEHCVRKSLGRDAEQPWKKLLAFRFPALALGLDPDEPTVRRGLRSRGTLQALIVGVAYGLPKESLRSAKAVRSELVWRVLRAAMPEIMGRGPFHSIDKPNAIDIKILSGLAGVRAKTIDQATTAFGGEDTWRARN